MADITNQQLLDSLKGDMRVIVADEVSKAVQVVIPREVAKAVQVVVPREVSKAVQVVVPREVAKAVQVVVPREVAKAVQSVVPGEVSRAVQSAVPGEVSKTIHTGVREIVREEVRDIRDEQLRQGALLEDMDDKIVKMAEAIDIDLTTKKTVKRHEERVTALEIKSRMLVSTVRDHSAQLKKLQPKN